MKTNHFRLFITIVLMVAAFASAGQPARGSKNENHEKKSEGKESFRPEKKGDYRDNIRFRGEERPVRKEFNHREIRRYEAPRAYDYKPSKDYRAHASPARVRVPDHFRGYRHYYYAPAYGHVIRTFPVSPLVFHMRGAKYYFHNDNFYHHRKGVGYIWIENPYGLVFPRLPHGAVQVHIGGRPYFRIGNVFFTHHPAGFEVVKIPARYYKARPVIHISASF